MKNHSISIKSFVQGETRPGSIFRSHFVCNLLLCLAMLLFFESAQAQQQVIINEINYRSIKNGEDSEFLELYNTQNTSIDLSGWQFTDGISYTFPAGTTIPANGYLVICADPAVCQSQFSINNVLGPFEGSLSNEADELVLRNAQLETEDVVDYEDWKEWPNVRFKDYEVIEPIPQNTSYSQSVTKKVAVSLQKINPSLDGKHAGAWSSESPTPKSQNNTVYQSNSNQIPVIKSVSKSPDNPIAGQAVIVEADFDNDSLYASILTVELEYQAMTAGNYIAKSNPAYQSNWTALPMLDDGLLTDGQANDGTYTVEIPTNIQQHRSMVRYRVKVTTTAGFNKTYPDSNHEESNYAYYVYNGHATFNGYDVNTLDPLQELTIFTTTNIANTYIGNGTDNATQYAGYDYLGEAAIIYNGKVYDHIRFRPRGKTRKPRVKPGLKIDMNSERKIQLLDDCGKEYDVPRGKLILSGTWVNDAASHGLTESLLYKMLDLTGGFAKSNDYASLRIVDRTQETGNTGDFWGIYLIQEDFNDDMVEEHNLPDGNLWSTFDPPTGGASARFLYVDSYGDFPGAETQAVWINQPRGQNYFPPTSTLEKRMYYGDWIANEFWANGEYNYFGKHSYREYYNPETGLWFPWCTDYDGAFGSGNNVVAVSNTSIADVNFDIRQPLNMPSSLQIEYKGALRSAYDLLLNQEQADYFVDSELKKIYDPSAAYDWVTIDHSRWGAFQTYPEGNVDAHFQFYKNWFQDRATYIRNNSTHGIWDNNIPSKPTIAHTGNTNLDNLSFSCSNYSGSSTFAAIEWRVGEWSDPSNPVYDSKCRPRYEIETVWNNLETSFSNTFTFPEQAQLKEGRTYKFRVRYKDQSGRWSHWSNAVTLIPTPVLPIDYKLVINEIMYNDDALCGDEFIEIYNNNSSSLTLDNFRFTEGIQYNFPIGSTIPANGYLVLAKDSILFVNKYGFSPFGMFEGSLSNSGEEIIFNGPYNRIVDTVRYDNNNEWDSSPDGKGTSLELLHPNFDNTYLENWFRSDDLCGTPAAPNSRICTGNVKNIVINEINYNSGASDAGDWVELYNPGNTAVDLSNWEFYDQGDLFVFPQGTTIAADGYLVIVQSTSLFLNVFPFITPSEIVGDFSFKLGNGGERISLFNPGKCLSDFVEYDDEAPWPLEPDGTGPTLSLISPTSENRDATSWESSSAINAPKGTPGRANVPCPSINIVPPTGNVCPGFATTFTVDNINSAVEYSWSFSGGNPATANTATAQVTWDFPGTKFITLTTSYKECSSSKTELLFVSCPVSDAFSVLEDGTLNASVSNSTPGGSVNLLGDTENGTVSMNSDGSFAYKPDPNYFGTEQFLYESCNSTTTNDTTIYSSVKQAIAQINSSIDDAEELPDGTLYFDSSDLEFMDDINRGTLKAVGLRLNNLSIPKGASIQNAYLQFVANEANSVSTSLTITGEDTGNAQPFSNIINPITGKNRTTASVAWNNVSSWAVSDVKDSPDLSTIVQEIVNRNDWNSGNSMTFILEGFGKRVAESYDNINTSLAPKLFISYESVDSIVIVPQTTQNCTSYLAEITVHPVNDAPVAMNDIEVIAEDGSLNETVLQNDSDIENDQLSINIVPVLLPQNGVLNLNTNGTYSFDPYPNYFGSDIFEYEVCDNGTPVIACDTGKVTIVITPVNDDPIAMIDSFTTTSNILLQENLLTNDFDLENDQLTASTMPVVNPSNGTVVIFPNGDFDYMPDAGFAGTDSFEYQVCDDGSPSRCTTAAVVLIVELDCIDIQLFALLEGAIDPGTSIMRNSLNMLGILPGQTPVGLGAPTPARQPYHTAPWNYQGQEGTNWTDANYTADMIDWVLISFRTGIQKTDQFAQFAGILHQDGTITIPESCALQPVQGIDSAYILVEHRNHMGIMTANKVPIVNGLLTYDFRTANTYTNTTGFGQKQLPSGMWAMAAGDCDQSDFPSYVIGGADKILWSAENGTFSLYRATDIDMDGDVKGKDKQVWLINNGLSSRVPK